MPPRRRRSRAELRRIGAELQHQRLMRHLQGLSEGEVRERWERLQAEARIDAENRALRYHDQEEVPVRPRGPTLARFEFPKEPPMPLPTNGGPPPREIPARRAARIAAAQAAELRAEEPAIGFGIVAPARAWEELGCELTPHAGLLYVTWTFDWRTPLLDIRAAARFLGTEDGLEILAEVHRRRQGYPARLAPNPSTAKTRPLELFRDPLLDRIRRIEL